jgi:hypothetical protein
MTPGTPGTPDDVTVYSANSPAAFRFLDGHAFISTAIGGSTIQLRSGTGGGGSALSDTFNTSATGRVKDAGTATVTPTLAAGSTLVVRRSDRGVGGEVILFLRRE